MSGARLAQMQSVLCSRPFTASLQHRSVAQAGRAGSIGTTAQPQQRWQDSQRPEALSLAASSSIRGCSCRSFAGTALPSSPAFSRGRGRLSGRGSRQVTRMGNPGAGGPFAPLVVWLRGIVGKKRFNQLRGKAISLHSQVIKDFTQKYLGANTKQTQGLIKTAKKNGERLGFLA